MFGAPLQILTGFASWQRYCTASSSGRQPNFASLNRGRHLCSAGRPSYWALAHILVSYNLRVNRGLLFDLRLSLSRKHISDNLGNLKLGGMQVLMVRLETGKCL